MVAKLRGDVALFYPPDSPEGGAALRRAKRAHMDRGPKPNLKEMSRAFTHTLAKRTAKAKARQKRGHPNAFPGLMYCPSEARRLRLFERATVPQKVQIKTRETLETLDEMWKEHGKRRTVMAQARAVSAFKVTLLRPWWGRRLWLRLVRKLG